MSQQLLKVDNIVLRQSNGHLLLNFAKDGKDYTTNNYIIPTEEQIDSLLKKMNLSRNDLRDTNKSLYDKTYTYEINGLLMITDSKFLYVVEECGDHDGDQDIHYYLKMFDSGKIVLDWELYSYNPYFGCNTLDLQWDEKNNIAYIRYSEKHKIYKCAIKPVSFDKGHQIYLKSQPNEFSRSENSDCANHELGKVVEIFP